MKRQRGASTLEFALTVAIFSVLAAVLLARLNSLQAEAERTEVELTVRNIRVGIQLAIGERIMHGEEERIDEVARANPVDFLGHRPRGYTDRGAAPTAGQWSYDPLRRELAYRPRRTEVFGDATELRWRYVAHRNVSGRTVGASLIGLN